MALLILPTKQYNTMTEDKRLFLLDAYALIYRAYYAFIKNPRINSKGFNTSAIYGFTNTLLEVLDKEKPTHIAVVFDVGECTIRTDNFPAYKANREATPEDISSAIPYIHKILDAFNIKTLGLAGYEADDLIGTLAKQAEKEGFTTYMMTPDKDYGQLVSENIFMYKPARMGKGVEVMGIPEVCARFDIERPEQVIDILGLMGDAVDNIPGVPGVGEKTAIKLIKDFGSVEGLYENTDKLKGKLKEKVEANHAQALMSKKLATIILDCPVQFKEGDYLHEAFNKEALKEVFTELEFKTTAQRLLGETLTQTNAQTALFGDEEPSEKIAFSDINTLEDTKHNYTLLEGEDGVKTLCTILKKAEAFCFDTETTDLDVMQAKIIGLAISCEAKSGYYLNIGLQEIDVVTKLLAPLKPFFVDANKTKIAHNLKYDLAILHTYDIKLEHKLFDTMLAHYLLNADERHGMDFLAETYLNYKPQSITELIGKKGKNQLTMDTIEPEKVKEYAAEDADITFQLYELFSPKLREDGLEELFNTLEMPLVPVLFAMEKEGIKLDVKALEAYSIDLNNRLITLEESIYKHAGRPFTINSPKQMGEVLFDELKIDEKPKKTKTGQYATGEEILVKLQDKHEIIKDILNYRQFNKLKSTYVDALPKLVNPDTGKIHTSFNQAVASTGRLSSNNPNLQNIPIRSADGREVRKAFIPRSDDFILLAADYSQVELRIIASLAKDENMIADFKAGQDIHATTAARVFGVKLEDVTRDLRSQAKAVNFGIIYGQSAFGLSQQLNIKRGEAKEIIDAYFEKYAAIKNYMDEQITLAKENEYVCTILGRKRHLADINSRNAIVRGFAERNAINAPIQGSAADIIKKAMIDILAAMKAEGFESRMLLQVHDELVFDAKKTEVEKLSKLVKEKMEQAVLLDVPLDVEIGIGETWLEAH